MKFSEMPYERVDRAWAEDAYRDLIARSAAAKSAAEQLAVHKDYYDLSATIETSLTLATIRHDIDTADPFYAAEQEYWDETGPVLQNLDLAYTRGLYNSPFRAELEAELGAPFFKNIELAMKAYDEKIIPLVQAENALATRYNVLIAGLRIEFDGKVYNLSQIRPHLIDPDRSVRRRALAAVVEQLQRASAEIDDIYDQMVRNRTEQARQLGFDNYVPLGYLRMQRNSYGQKEVEAFRKQVKEVWVPLTARLNEARRKRLGVDRLGYCDNGVYFADGNPAPTGTPEQILAAGQQMYSELGPETKEFFAFMRDNELFDVLGRSSKAQGGYQAYLPKYRAPFIFANFNGTDGDVNVITHECGHAFQCYLQRNEPVRERTVLGMETAEIHSMSMEYFTYRWMELFFGDKADKYRAMHSEDSIDFLPYGCMVDEFQHIVYSRPELTPAERREVWRGLEKQYRPHLDLDAEPFLAGAFWQKQGHIFQMPFYYIDYCLATACAMQFKVRMDADYPAAWADYLKLCKLGGRDFYTDLLPQAGLRVPFEDGFLADLAKKLCP